MTFSLNVRRNWLNNTLIIPNENYFVARAENYGSEKVEKWVIATCAAADLFFKSLLFENDSKNNLFYTKRGDLNQLTVQQLFKVLAVFFLYLELERSGRDDDFVSGIFEVFELPESEYENLILYKKFENKRNEIDYSEFPESIDAHMKTSRVSHVGMIHFYELLKEAGFGEKIINLPRNKETIKQGMTVPTLAASFFDEIVAQNT